MINTDNPTLTILRLDEINYILEISSYRIVHELYNDSVGNYTIEQVLYFANPVSSHPYWSTDIVQAFDKQLLSEFNDKAHNYKSSKAMFDIPEWLLEVSVSATYNNEWVVNSKEITREQIAQWVESAFTRFLELETYNCKTCKAIHWNTEIIDDNYCIDCIEEYEPDFMKTEWDNLHKSRLLKGSNNEAV